MANIEIPRLQKQYIEKCTPDLIKAFGYENIMEVPKVDKIVLNMGIGENV